MKKLHLLRVGYVTMSISSSQKRRGFCTRKAAIDAKSLSLRASDPKSNLFGPLGRMTAKMTVRDPSLAH